MTIPLKKIICAVDFSASSDAVVRYAATLHGEGSELVLLHVAPEESNSDGMLRELLHEFSRYSDTLSQHKVKLLFALEYGDAATAILDYAVEHKAEMMILGSHGKSAIGRLLVGSTAETVMRKATCPVVILKTPDNNEKN